MEVYSAFEKMKHLLCFTLKIQCQALYDMLIREMTFNFGHKCTTNESNAKNLKSIFNKVI